MSRPGQPYRPHGPILGMDEDAAPTWAVRFNRRGTIAAIIMLGVILVLVGGTSL